VTKQLREEAERMKKAGSGSSSSSTKKMRPALSPEARENQMISLAVDLAEKQLMEGTASSQVITHFLKLATTKSQLENEKLQKENELLKAKRESLESSQRSEELFEEAIKAMKSYSGYGDPDDY
jgi:hypothetical protein